MDQTLRNAVLDRLDQLGWAAAAGDAEAVLPAARSELCRLADGFRALLDEHQPDENGRCRACPGMLRGRRWPCTVWVTVRRHLLGSPAHHTKEEEPRTAPAQRTDSWALPSREPETSPVADVSGETTQPEGFAWFTRLPVTAAPQPAPGYGATGPTAIYRAPVVERRVNLF